MGERKSRVVIAGVGNVGATTAYSIINQGLCEEIVLIDVNREKALAEAMDMEHSTYFMNRNIKVREGEYEDCREADIVVITASAPMPKSSNNRLEMLAPSMGIIRSIVTEVMKSGFSGIFVVVSNPVDIMTYYCWKISGLPKERVIGSGTTLDTARLCISLSKLYELDAKSVQAYVIGEHGDSELVSWDSANIGGKNISDVMRDNAERTAGKTKEELLRETVQAGWDIFQRKGNTCYGIAASTTAIIKSILFDENRIYPVSVMLDGAYGLKNVFLSAPTILNRQGAKEVVEIHLNPEELAAYRRSAKLLSDFYEELC